MTIPTPAVRAVSALVVGAALYLALLLARFFFPPYIPRFRLEGVFVLLIAAAVLAVFLRNVNERRGLAAGTPPGWQSVLGAGLILLLLAGLLYGSVLPIGLLSDDFDLVASARRGQWIYGNDTAFARPLVPLVWSLLLSFPGAERLLHGLAIALHGLNALLVVVLATRWRMPREQAQAAGVLFVLWPGLTEAIVWVSGTHDVMMTTCVLVSLICLLRADEHAGWAAGAVAAAMLALGAKETAIVTPLLGWGVWWASTPRPRGTRPIWALGLMTAAAMAFALFRLSAPTPDGFTRDVSQYFLKQLLLDPYAALGAPWSTDWVRAHRSAGLQRAWLIVALVAVAALTWRRETPAFRRAIVAGGWVFLAVVPVWSYFHVAANLEGGRYLYLPAAGFALLLAVLGGGTARLLPGYLRVPALGSIVVALAVPPAVAIPDEVIRWHEAANVRDAIVREAVAHPSLASCGSFLAAGQADNVRGAYVFRNGLAEALGRTGASGARCAIEWNGERLTLGPTP